MKVIKLIFTISVIGSLYTSCTLENINEDETKIEILATGCQGDDTGSAEDGDCDDDDCNENGLN